MDQKPDNQNGFKKKHRYYDRHRHHGNGSQSDSAVTEKPDLQTTRPQTSSGENGSENSNGNFNRRHHKHKPNQHKVEDAAAVNTQTAEAKSTGSEQISIKDNIPEQSAQKSKPQQPQQQQNGYNNNNNFNNRNNRQRGQFKPNCDESAASEEAPQQNIQRPANTPQNQTRREQREPREVRPQKAQFDRRSLPEEPQKIEDAAKPVSESVKPQSTVIPGPEVLDDIPKFTKIASSAIDDEAPKVKVVGIQFKAAGKVYYFDPGEIKLTAGSHAIVETARGLEFGEVIFDQRMVSENSIVKPLRPVIRQATPEDIAHNKENEAKEESIFKIGQEKITAHGLDMKLVDAQYTFDNSKLLFYFTSAGRVDFRELVKDLAGVFHTRIELRQIGIRDEAKMMGSLGACGRPLCCASFLADFVQVSIKMAKEQSLSLNSNKISGACGRLMCCLRYEYESYEAEIRLMPPLGSKVKTADGIGFVTELSPIAGTVKVNIDGQDTPLYKVYKKDDVTVLSRPAVKAQSDADDDSDVLPNE